MFSSLAASITSYLSEKPFNYDFKLLSIAVSLVYAYGLGLPIALWLVLRYLNVSEWSLVEAIAVFGYGQFIWIPVSVRILIRPHMPHMLHGMPWEAQIRRWSQQS